VISIGNYNATVKSNRLGIAGYLEEFANFADLQTFYNKYYPVAAGSNFTVESINGGINPQSPDEAGKQLLVISWRIILTGDG
jgi:tripeptidyl-peptidase-1